MSLTQYDRCSRLGDLEAFCGAASEAEKRHQVHEIQKKEEYGKTWDVLR